MNKEFFKKPTTNPDYSISGFWFWNDLITDEKTTEQLNMMKRIGANQPVIHSRGGLVNEYLSEDWFDRIKHVVNIAKQNEQKLWIYDEDNWPSGNCSHRLTKNETLREHYLSFEIITLAKGSNFNVVLSDKQYVNITAYCTNGELINLISDAKDGNAEFTASCDTEIYLVSVSVDPYDTVGKYSIDYLSKDAFRTFIESTHERYKEHLGNAFGNVITGMFMDETRFCNALPWTDTLTEEFIKRKGYDLRPYLPFLIKKSEESALIRYDYYDVVSDLYAEATCQLIYNWCEENGLQATGHFLGEETICAQTYFGADMCRGYKYFHIPGIDHLGNGIGSLQAKFAVSAANNYGKSRISCEGFGGAGWDVTYEELVKMTNWLLQQGVNLIMLHGFYYSVREERYRDWPPSYFYQWKYWDMMPQYAAMTNRMMEVLSNGWREEEILVYSPIESFWTHFEPDLNLKTGFGEKGPKILDERAAQIDTEFQVLCNRLADENLDFNILGSDAVKNFYVENNRLVNKLTGQTYSVFILPFAEILTEETISLLNQFTAAGGTVITFETNINYVVSPDGSHIHGGVSKKLDTSHIINKQTIREIICYCENEIALPFKILRGIDATQHNLLSYPAMVIDPYLHNGEGMSGIAVSRYLKEDKRIFHFTNYNSHEEKLTLSLKSSCIPEIYNPENGDIFELTEYREENGAFVFDIAISANRSLLFVCGK